MYLQDKYLGQYPDKVRRTLQSPICPRKACLGEEREIMFRQEHLLGMRALSDFTQLKVTVITFNGCLLEHKHFHFHLEWSRWSWMQVVTGGKSLILWPNGCRRRLISWAVYQQNTVQAFWPQHGKTRVRKIIGTRQRAMPSCANTTVFPPSAITASVESAHGHLKQCIWQPCCCAEITTSVPSPARHTAGTAS